MRIRLRWLSKLFSWRENNRIVNTARKNFFTNSCDITPVRKAPQGCREKGYITCVKRTLERFPMIRTHKPDAGFGLGRFPERPGKSNHFASPRTSSMVLRMISAPLRRSASVILSGGASLKLSGQERK